MLDPQNIITISGGLVADPQMVADGKIMKSRIGVDYSGSEKDSDNNSGYFDIVYYLKDKNGYTCKNAGFVDNQISSAKMKKGTSVSIIGRLVQERWKQDDGSSRSKVVIVIEHMSYGARSAKSSDSNSSSNSTSSESSASIPSSF